MINLPVVLPNGFSPVVKQGDTVIVGQVLAQPSGKTEFIINIPQMLSVQAGKAKKIMKKNPGDAVEINDILAVKKRFFGRKEKLISKVNGTVMRYERESGNLVIRSPYTTLTENLNSPVDGIVTLCDNEKIILGTDKDMFSGTKGNESSGEGEVFILQESFSQNAQGSEMANAVYFLDGRAIGKIVIGGNLTREVLVKGIGIGAAGMIGTNINTDDLKYIEEKRLMAPVLELESDIIKKLIAWKGKRVYIEGESKTVILLHS